MPYLKIIFISLTFIPANGLNSLYYAAVRFPQYIVYMVFSSASKLYDALFFSELIDNDSCVLRPLLNWFVVKQILFGVMSMCT